MKTRVSLRIIKYKIYRLSSYSKTGRLSVNKYVNIDTKSQFKSKIDEALARYESFEMRSFTF